MSLVEAIEQVRVVQYCDQIEALRQLKNEIKDGMVPTKWGSPSVLGRFKYGPGEPDARSLSASQLLLVGVGFAPDKRHGHYRPLLIGRSAVERLWSHGLDARHPDDHDVGRRGDMLRPKQRVTDDQIREVAREVYKTSGKDPPNIGDAEQLIRGRLPGAQRKAIRPILDEEDFAKLRRKPGNQPKR